MRAALPLAPDAVLSVSESSSALAAFRLMKQHGRSALGVTATPGGRLVACITTSDLRGLRAQDFGRLALPLSAFLAAVHAPPTPTVPSASRLLTTTGSDPLAAVLTTLADEHVHHVFVVDAMTGIAQAMITPFDVLRVVSEW